MLRQVRNIAFAFALCALALLIGLTIWSQTHSPPDVLLGCVIAAMVASGIVFAVAVYHLATRKIQTVATADRDSTAPSRGPSPFVIGVGLVVVLANLGAVLVTGNASLLGLLLVCLVVLLLVLIQRHARGR